LLHHNVDGFQRQPNGYDCQPIRIHYFAHLRVECWHQFLGRDILGTSTLPCGSSANINFDDGSGYYALDFKIVFSDGSVGIENGIDMCTTATYTIR
jgi:hypothetical protein